MPAAEAPARPQLDVAAPVGGRAPYGAPAAPAASAAPRSVPLGTAAAAPAQSSPGRLMQSPRPKPAPGRPRARGQNVKGTAARRAKRPPVAQAAPDKGGKGGGASTGMFVVLAAGIGAAIAWAALSFLA